MATSSPKDAPPSTPTGGLAQTRAPGSREAHTGATAANPRWGRTRSMSGGWDGEVVRAVAVGSGGSRHRGSPGGVRRLACVEGAQERLAHPTRRGLGLLRVLG